MLVSLEKLIDHHTKVFKSFIYFIKVRGNKNKQVEEKVTRHNNGIINPDSFEYRSIFNRQFCKLTLSDTVVFRFIVLISDSFDCIFAEDFKKSDQVFIKLKA